MHMLQWLAQVKIAHSSLCRNVSCFYMQHLLLLLLLHVCCLALKYRTKGPRQSKNWPRLTPLRDLQHYAMDMQVPQIAMPYSEEQIAAMREALAQNEAETAALKVPLSAAMRCQVQQLA